MIMDLRVSTVPWIVGLRDMISERRINYPPYIEYFKSFRAADDDELYEKLQQCGFSCDIYM